MEDERPAGDCTGSGETAGEAPRQEQVTRREFMRRAALAVGGVAAAGTILASLGCDTA
ncbi:MAG: hypothetical protein QOH93_2090, partial [Chloroflexia bacterium]|nr:hypothetical protein [Chloroflexia bacterium]